MKTFDDVAAYLQQQTEVFGRTTWVTLTALPEPHELHSPLAGNTMDTPWTEAENLDAMHKAIENCMKCPLGTTRIRLVFGTGNPNAEIMVIGEAPGADEDEQGLPFVGRAGQLLTKILESIDLNRADVYVANIIKCRPPNNRKPTPFEIESCEPYLWKQIDLVRPRFILALGLTAANTLLKNKSSMKDLRGIIHNYHGIQTIVTYHPAALLRNPSWKKETWEDVKFLRSLIHTSNTSNTSNT
ncbi:MAG: uracil-DNA glycosylase [Chlorobi bacterium]|nr:uracil-DNA glycosylase [Chlorobiota bacterium]NOG68126.1 uracil-DNA glycosylase [Chlorobiota bacterium]